MMLRELNFAELKAENKSCVMFAKDGNHPTRHRRDLYPVEAVTGADDLQNLYIEVVQEDYNRSFRLWTDCGGFCFAIEWILDWRTLEEIPELIRNRFAQYAGGDGIKKMVMDLMSGGVYVNNCHIEAMRLMNEPELVKVCTEYRAAYIEQLEAKRAERSALFKKEQEERERRHAEEVQAAIDEAITAIKGGGSLKNDRFEGSTMVLYLMRLYNINVPLRTAGWINDKLASVTFTKDSGISVRFYRAKNCKCSNAVFEYLGKLQKAVCA